MDYEKAYKAVLETATQWIKDGCTDKERVCLESVFPELRESEDEIHRKWILEYLYDGLRKADEQFKDHFKAAIDWLEKQKESLHISGICKENADSFTDACMDVIVAIEKYLDWLTGYPDYAPKGKYSIRDMLYCLSLLEKQKPENVSATTMAPSCWEVEQKEQKPLITGNDFGWIDELKHDLKHPEELDEKVQEVLKKRQKPVERSLEDDHIIGFVYDLLNEIEWKDNWAMSKEECLGRLKSLRPPLKDKEMKLKILKYLSTRCSSLEFEEVEDYLNNLRPSWKPSEEQMEALDKALYYVPEEIGIPIAEIYGHFNKMKKKLM